MSVAYDRMVWLRREEETDLGVTAQLLNAGDTFVDIGANIGLYTLVAATTVGTLGSVISVEPNATTFDRLALHIKENSLNNVNCVNAAASSSLGFAWLNPSEHHYTAHLEPEGADTGPSSGCQRVKSTTVDNLTGDERVSGMKVDVEGHELEVLRGADRTLDRWHPWLIIEFNTIICGATRLDEWAVDRLLRSKGYRPRLIGGKGGYLDESWRTDGYVNLLYE